MRLPGRRGSNRLLWAFLSFALVLAGCGAGGTAGGSSETKPVLKIGYLPITHSLPVVVAKNQHQEFQHFKLELVRFGSWPDLMDAYHSGAIQGAVAMLEMALADQVRGMPAEVELLTHRGGDVLVAAPGIHSIADLNGKRVGIPHRLSGHNILLYEALKKAGIDFRQVEKVEMAPPEMVSALARGDISAYVVAEPFGAKAVLAGTGHVLARAEDIIPGWICCGLIVNPQWRAQHPEAVKELVKAVADAGTLIDQHRDEAVQIAAKELNIAPDLWKKSLEWIRFNDLAPQRGELETLQNRLLAIPWDNKPGSLLPGRADIGKLVGESAGGVH
ncbi:MAG: ABC transporter substrate-binding protein [Alicyclobacillaceae bacterium]|nr:ABC transporter substrate-binding protein [Alicyclobacillaceae bacterium]